MDGLKRLKAKPEGDEESVNLLKEHLKESEELTFPTNDYNEGYKVRKDFLARVFHNNMAYLNAQFGPRPDDNSG